jgi:hypothetical protein
LSINAKLEQHFIFKIKFKILNALTIRWN